MSKTFGLRHCGEGGVPVGGATNGVDQGTRPVEMHWHPGLGAAIGPLLNAALGAQRERAPEHYAQAIDALSRREEQAVSLSIKVPFCASHCLCCERDIRAAQPSAVIDDYVAGLTEEMRLVAARLGSGREVVQLHLGGGTANELSESQLLRLVHALQQHWRLPADAEMSAECDPRRVSWAQLQLMRGLGFRHVTLGVLDLDPNVQQAIGRRLSASLVDDVCDLARSCGIESLNLDLMIGLPHQTEASWRATLQRLLAMAPDRVTLARYRHRPRHAPGQCAIDADALPDAETCRALAALAVDMLCDAGYRWIGADQFVLENDALSIALDQGQLRRTLISYTATPPAPLLGLGVGAIGEVDGSVFWNEAAQPAWREALRQGRLPVAHTQLATPREARRRLAVEQLLCGLELPQSEARDGLEAAYQRLAGHAPNGLVRVFDDRIVVTPQGRHALPLLCGEFDEPAPTAVEPRWLS